LRTYDRHLSPHSAALTAWGQIASTVHPEYKQCHGSFFLQLLVRSVGVNNHYLAVIIEIAAFIGKHSKMFFVAVEAFLLAFALETSIGI